MATVMNPNLADVTRMLGQAAEKVLNAVRGLFAEYASEDIDDLESLIELGRLELQLSENSIYSTDCKCQK